MTPARPDRVAGGPRSLGPTELKRLHRGWRRRTDQRLALLLDGVMTPANVGSILRLAAAYGVERMWTTALTADVAHPGAQRTAMGTERYVEVVEGLDPAAAIAAAAADGFEVVAVELAAGAVPVFEADLAGRPICLALGHEDHGLTAPVMAAASAIVYLPLVGRVGSLNVATAAGIALAEARRQEWTRLPPPGRPEEDQDQ